MRWCVYKLLPAEVDPFLSQLPRSVLGMGLGFVAYHLHPFPSSALFTAVLSDHIQLANPVLKEGKKVGEVVGRSILKESGRYLEIGLMPQLQRQNMMVPTGETAREKNADSERSTTTAALFPSQHQGLNHKSAIRKRKQTWVRVWSDMFSVRSP